MRSPDASLDELLTVREAGEGRYAVELPAGWGQGRFLFGGLVAGLLTRALETFHPGRPLRSLAAELLGPARPGDGVVQLEVLRDGNTVSTVSARLVQDGEVMAHAVGVLGGTRPTEPDRVALTPPALTDWRTLAPPARRTALRPRVRPPLGLPHRRARALQRRQRACHRRVDSPEAPGRASRRGLPRHLRRHLVAGPLHGAGRAAPHGHPRLRLPTAGRLRRP